MRNRAKCKLCNSIIESHADADYILCSCGEIAISGGQKRYEVFANDLTSVIRIDDEGNEIIPKIVEKSLKEENATMQKWAEEIVIENIDKRKLLLDELKMMIENYEKLPPHTMANPINGYDFCSLLRLLSMILGLE